MEKPQISAARKALLKHCVQAKQPLENASAPAAGAAAADQQKCNQEHQQSYRENCSD